ncbi:MAG TPA: hypothetical protein VEQ66_12435 [Propionibacteriaceae bacterium]|nr:hypothetical protein [Propionibacteriaceae bacterium]
MTAVLIRALKPAKADDSDLGNEAAKSQVCRVVLGELSLLGLLAGLVGFELGVDWLRTFGFLTFVLFGVGSAPWQLNPRLETYERLTLTVITGFGVMTVVAQIMMSADVWRPYLAFGIIVAITLPLHLVGLLRALNELGVQQARTANSAEPISWDDQPATPGAQASTDLTPMPSMAAARATVLDGLFATLPATLGAVLCLVAALTHQHLAPGFYGYLPHIGPLWYLGLALVLVGIALGGRSEHSRAIPVVLVVLVLTLTPAIVYDGPRAQTAARHIAFIEQIQSVHELTSSVPIYNAFAGFFAAMAFVCDVLGVTDLVRVAAFWPPIVGVFRVLVLRYLVGQFLPRADQCWIAVALAVLADSIGADYFSPQAVGFIIGMAAFGVALSTSTNLLKVPVLLLAGATLAISHQLSPYVVSGVLVVLVVFRQIRPWWTPLLVLGPSLLWAATHFWTVRQFVSFGDLGQLSNFRPPKTVGSPGLERVPVVLESSLSLAIGGLIVGILALVTFFRNRKQLRAWGIAASASVGLVLVAVNPYGQEGIFRAILFALPWLAILASAVFVRGLPTRAQPRSSRVWRSRAGVFLTSVCLAATFLVSSSGLDGLNVIRPSDYAALQKYRQQGGPNSPDTYFMLMLTSRDMPTTPDFRDDNHIVWGRDDVDAPVRQEKNFNAERQMRLLTDRFVTYTTESSPDEVEETHLYAMWSPVGARYAQAYALQSLEQSEALRDAFLKAPYWSVELASDGSYLFTFRRDQYTADRT